MLTLELTSLVVMCLQHNVKQKLTINTVSGGAPEDNSGTTYAVSRLKTLRGKE